MSSALERVIVDGMRRRVTQRKEGLLRGVMNAKDSASSTQAKEERKGAVSTPSGLELP
jgi:hypothetical protein